MTKSPVAMIILDGFGYRFEQKGNAVAQAKKPNFDRYWANYPHSTLSASGESVGLPEGQMGNSEVGHTNIGAGRIVYQSISRIDQAFQNNELDQNEAFNQAISHALTHDSALHFMGLVSDGGVHSHSRHLYAMLEKAKEKGVKKVFVHAFTDGRDVAPDSGVGFINDLMREMHELGIGQLATIMGRFFAMDRDNRWERVEIAYQAIFHGQGKEMDDPMVAIEKQYDMGVTDEFLPPLVKVQDGQAIGSVKEDDAIIFFNFRPDRAIQLSHAISDSEFDFFQRGVRPRNLSFVTMMQYTGDMNTAVMFPPIMLKNTVGEVLASNGLTQLRIAETEKYPHVTYFMNGGLHDEFEGEERIMIPSPKVETYDLKPEMSAYELTDALIKEIKADKFDVIILNFANPDMVGHSGKLEPTIKAIEAVDDNLGEIVDLILEKNGTAIIFADHGNADTLTTEEGYPHTAHTTVPVPVIVTKKGLTLRDDGVLADVVPTMLDLLDVPQAKEMTGQTLIQ